MKGIKNVRNVVVLSTIGVLAVGLIVITFIFRSNSQQEADQTSSVRASNLTYKRELDLIAGVSPTTSQVMETPTVTASPSSTIFPSISSTASQSATLSGRLTTTPTVYLSPTVDFMATESATPISSLPRTGWTQNVSIMFITASVLMFVSFLF